MATRSQERGPGPHTHSPQKRPRGQHLDFGPQVDAVAMGQQISIADVQFQFGIALVKSLRK